MRRAGRTDANQSVIVAALRKLGCSVAITSGAGNGLPDLLVGWRGVTVLMEIKDGAKRECDRPLTEAEAHFLATWKGGPAVVVKDEQEAINAVLAHRRGDR